ncbi:D-alanyl-D-alanine carboxypeptidase/D-alanyl-D-alanine-endopeptidase (penicillin-binding protein 4) [Bacillus oleivorans]|uniref:D-alanyl-D-alanine carboxypeptidase/D-alanyl-D-alanine-endopeptidase (Penicillin-binding protein 4) n=1 Tax=Bacillus oleivorans TaxID=1448271 RepID=A0A285CGX7_9BACI|nr:D-alanyl-D-alanine carboxypeptidase/D-alanyl-D-alanine-endopeptidase [Bacillus oleivorans]SNX66769.1 D-alanyl-D-alanine carboxypeptidase/D-alanyl-D-alanine-endopeptidase (penicillin-binding protein 4) [Bacillus oleivorans]
MARTLFLLILMAMVTFVPFTTPEKTKVVEASKETTEVVVSQSPDLQAKIDAILNDERLQGTSTGVSIRNADTGEVLYSYYGDMRLHPASNMKLLTTIAALETLGEDYQFTTEVLTDGSITGNVLQGNLYIKGKGDPTLLEKDFDQFAKDLKAKGIQQINGNLIGDDSWYDDIRLSQDLNWSDESYYTGAQVSALTLSPNEDYDAGTVIVEVTPSTEVGGKAQVKVTPETDYVTILNNTEMVAAGQSKRISIEREHGTNNIVVEGVMPLNGTTSRSWVAVWEPTGYALDVFKKSLKEQGIALVGNADVKVGVTPENATVLTAKKSMTLEDLLIPFMKLSNNGHGETLTKEMGKVVYGEGSWDKGLQVIEEVITDFGVNGDTILLRDGSGMSHKNMIPANEITQLLYAVQDESWYPAFEQSLPVAGESDRLVGGTLRSRMTSEPAKGNVKAKTGSLTGVSTLSGYVTSADGKKLIFSIMFNNYLGFSATSIENSIATTLAGHEF